MIRFVRRTVRFSQEEIDRYNKAAEKAGVEFSEWVRQACDAFATRGQTRSRTVKFPVPDRPRGHAQGCVCSGCRAATAANVSSN